MFGHAAKQASRGKGACPPPLLVDAAAGETWDSHKEFYVIGSHTGTRYRIRRATAMNIDELNSRGRVVTQWCFAPQGELADCDIMLAQKIALETMEWTALASANRRVC